MKLLRHETPTFCDDTFVTITYCSVLLSSEATSVVVRAYTYVVIPNPYGIFLCFLTMMNGDLKVHKREKFFGSDFEFFTIL